MKENNRYLIYVDGFVANTKFGLHKMTIELKDCTVEDFEKYLQSYDKSVSIKYAYKLPA